VCLSVGEHIPRTARPVFPLLLCMHVTYGCGSAICWRRCDTLYTSGLMGDVMFALIIVMKLNEINRNSASFHDKTVIWGSKAYNQWLNREHQFTDLTQRCVYKLTHQGQQLSRAKSEVYDCLLWLLSAIKVKCRHLKGVSVAEWLACWTQAQKGQGSNRSRDAVG